MIYEYFPYLRVSPLVVGSPVLARIMRTICGHGVQDDQTGDASDGPAWFGSLNLSNRDTIAGLVKVARGLSPDEWPAETAAADLAAADSFGHTIGGGLIYGRMNDGGEVVAGFATPAAMAAAWESLVGVWSETSTDALIDSLMAEPYTDTIGGPLKYGRDVMAGDGFHIASVRGFRGTGIAFALIHDDGRELYQQGDADRVAVASCFGYRMRGPNACECFKHTDGSISCAYCGKSAADYIEESSAIIAAVVGTGRRLRARNPGFCI